MKGELVYWCPGCHEVQVHVGSLISQCTHWYFGCMTWTVAVADENCNPLPGSHLKLLPRRM